MATLGGEFNSVQHPLTQHATECGWDLVSQEDALSWRRGETGLFFYDLLKEKLLELNPGVVTPESVDGIIKTLESVRNNIEGNSEILAWLRGERGFYMESEKRHRNVTLVHFDNPAKNVYHVTEEWQYTNGSKTNRADAVFLINGVPIALVECKSVKKHNAMEEALSQIRRYHNETPEMVTSPQLFDFSHLIEFFYGVTWNLDRKNIFPWKHQEKTNYEAKVKAFFAPERVLEMLNEWILFFVKDDELQKTVLRQHQTRAVAKVVQRCADPGKTRGLIWHTQGSGKTFTMITAARLILERKDVFGQPTVILVIDRNELEGQLLGWVDRLLGEMQNSRIPIEHANRKTRLVELLKSDFRGLIVTMIHKFDSADKDLNTRPDVYLLIDEAHRSTGGDLGTYMMAALPNATLIGFTGTPRDLTAHGKGTFKVFGKEDEQGYLDKYSIAESIEDGTTVSLKYTHAPNKLSLPGELLEAEFLKLTEAEAVAEVEDLNRILDRAVKTKTFLKAADRVEQVAEFVASHFLNNVKPLGYKAFLVAVDREACALYKQALDKHLPPEWSVPVYTPSHNDSEKFPLVAKYQLAEEAEKSARKNFAKPGQLPQILIVTDKLLTGYDAPVLFCMYLDKPMRDHVLLQAIARVNRPYEEETNDGSSIQKPCGLVVDFVGVLGKLKRALRFDSAEVSGVIEDLDLLLQDFIARITGPAKDFLNLTSGTMDDKATEKAIDAFADPEKREEFYRFYKELEQLHEVLSPDAALHDYLDDFGRLVALYEVVRNAYGVKTSFLGDVAKKTEQLIRERATSYGLAELSKPVSIDEKMLARLKESDASDNNKVVNLLKGIEGKIKEKGEVAPYLIGIKARADAIRKQYDERQVTTAQARQQLELLWQEALEFEDTRKRSMLDDETFVLFWELQKLSIADAKPLAMAANAVFSRFPNFQLNVEEKRQLKAELYKILFTVFEPTEMVKVAESLMRVRSK